MISVEKIQKQHQKFESTDNPSNLDCFKAHRGFRNGEVHTFVGPRGGGKSTLSKTIIGDLITQGKKVMILISEEEYTKYLVPIYLMLTYSPESTKEYVEKMMLNIKIISELELSDPYKKKFWEALKYDIDDFAPDVFIYDNYTTGFMAAKSVDKQYEAMLALRRLASSKNIPVLIFLHSDKKTRANDKAMSSEDVKGLSTIVNIGSYNYVIQPVFKDGIRINFLIIDKSRYHAEADKTIWELKYNSKIGIFLKSFRIDRKDYDDVFVKKKPKREEF